MTRMDEPAAHPVTNRVQRAIADAGVGEDALFTDLFAMDAVAVAVSGGTVSVTVTLPVPAPGLRAELERALHDAIRGVDGVAEVVVDWGADAADPGHRVDILPNVKNVVAVASGKGGVGKSTVAANLAVALADAGAAVGLLDADVYGPNAPELLGLDDGTPTTTADARIVPREAHGVDVMSMGFVVGEEDPIIWRGPMVDDVLKQLTGDVDWGDLDYLVVDMPPGTGDAQMTLVQHLPVAGVVIVTTPQAVAVDDARRGLEGYAKYDVPVLGLVENMRRFECPDCGGVHEVFGAGGADALAAEFEVPVLGRLPIDSAIGTLSGEERQRGVELPVIGRVGLPRTRSERGGRLPPVVLRDDEVGVAFREAATRIAARVNAAASVDFTDDLSP